MGVDDDDDDSLHVHRPASSDDDDALSVSSDVGDNMRFQQVGSLSKIALTQCGCNPCPCTTTCGCATCPCTITPEYTNRASLNHAHRAVAVNGPVDTSHNRNQQKKNTAPRTAKKEVKKEKKEEP